MIKVKNVKDASIEFLNETFTKFEFNAKNAVNLIAAKMFASKMLKHIDFLADENGNIDVDELEKYTMEVIDKFGDKIQIPAIGTYYTFYKADFHNLFVKIKSKEKKEVQSDGETAS